MRAYYQYRLQDIYNKRIERNPDYSLRSFALDIGVNSGTLSQILSGKRIPSYKKSLMISEALKMNESQSKKFLKSIAKTRNEMGFKRRSPEFEKLLDNNISNFSSSEISQESFKAISDWYHYAIMEMVSLKDFQPDARWIAKELGLKVIQAQSAIDRLFDLKILEEVNGRWFKTRDYFNTSNKRQTSVALKKRQEQILNKSIDALNNIPIEMRNHSAMTMAIDMNKIPEAKLKIRTFLKEMNQLLDVEEENSSVYELTVNLFPLRRISK